MSTDPKQDRIDVLERAIKWVLTDASFKAPEQIDDIAERWIDVLQDAFEAEA